LYQYVPFIDVILMNSKTLREEKEIGEWRPRSWTLQDCFFSIRSQSPIAR
jgi:hypothetical protein